MTLPSADELQALSRQQLHERACDALAADGKKPGISGVRAWTLTYAGIKRGSDTDTQADIHAWYQQLFALKRSRPLPDVPAPVAALFAQLWEQANKVAWEALQAERQAVADERAAAQQHLAVAEGERRQLAAALEEAERETQALKSALAQRDRETAALDAKLARCRALLMERDSRIYDLLEDQQRLDTEHKTLVATLTENQRRADTARIDAERRAQQEIEHARLQEREARSIITQLEERRAKEAEAARSKIGDLEREVIVLQERIPNLNSALQAATGQVSALQAQLGQTGRPPQARKDPPSPARPITTRRRLRKSNSKVPRRQ